MVNTRGADIALQLKETQYKLLRSEQKLQLILKWIQKTFGENNHILSDLWNIIHNFDQESAAWTATSLDSTQVGNNLPRILKSSTPRRKEVEKEIQITQIRSLTPAELKPEKNSKTIKKGRVEYVVVQSLASENPSITVLPQGAGKFFNKNSTTELPLFQLPTSTLTPTTSVPQRKAARARKIPHKLRWAQENGDEVDIPNISTSIVVPNDEDSGDSLAVNSDPLRISNPPSPCSNANSDPEDTKYEPEMDILGSLKMSDSDKNNLSTRDKNTKSRKKNDRAPAIADTNLSTATDIPQMLFTCTNCDKKFHTSFSFAKHQLLHDALQESVLREVRVQIPMIPTPPGTNEMNTPRYNKLLKRKIKVTTSKPLKKNKPKPTQKFIKKKIITKRQPTTNILGLNKKSGRPKGSGRVKGPYICEICGKLLQSNGSFHSHVKIQHGPKESFPCTICGVILKSKTSLASHTRLHDGIKPYLCSVCGNSFARRSTLEIHMKLHSEDRNYKCIYCDMTFRQKQGLMIHTNRHLGRLERECPICGQSHTTNNNLKRHIKAVHEKQRNHKCHICDKAFKEPNHLKYHVKTHDNPNSKKRGLNREREDTRFGSKRSLSGRSHRRIVRISLNSTIPQENITQQINLKQQQIFTPNEEYHVTHPGIEFQQSKSTIIDSDSAIVSRQIPPFKETTIDTFQTEPLNDNCESVNVESVTVESVNVESVIVENVAVESEDTIEHNWLLNL